MGVGKKGQKKAKISHFWHFLCKIAIGIALALFEAELFIVVRGDGDFPKFIKGGIEIV